MSTHTQVAACALEHIRANKLEQHYKGQENACVALVAMQQHVDIRFITAAHKRAVKEILEFLELCFKP